MNNVGNSLTRKNLAQFKVSDFPAQEKCCEGDHHTCRYILDMGERATDDKKTYSRLHYNPERKRKSYLRSKAQKQTSNRAAKS